MPIVLGDALGDWGSIITSIVNMGFAALVAWYLLTKAFPKMLESFREELRVMREHYEGQDGKRSLEHKESLEVVIEHCEKEGERRDMTMRTELGLVHSAMKDTREVLEELRDVIKDVVVKKA